MNKTQWLTTSLITREMQIKTIVISQYTPTKMIKINVLTNIGKDVITSRTPMHCWWECELI